MTILHPHEYTLWLELAGEERAQLRKLIRYVGNQTQTVIFEPHITLLGGIATNSHGIVTLVRRWAEAQAQATIPLMSLEIAAAYYKCLYAPCEPQGLEVFNRKVQNHFGVDVAYAPHVSLLYGEVSDAQKKALQQHIQPEMPKTLTVTSLSL